jgi:Family of unknown function (DUF5686)
MNFNFLYVLNKNLLLKLIVLLLLFTHSLQAQFNISGIVKDAKTLKPLAFATVKLETGKKIVTDIDGKFYIQEAIKLNFIDVSYVAHLSSKIDVNDGFYYQIILFPTEKVSVLKNEAIKIITKVIENKNNNNPETKFQNFRFKAYNKLIITANPDSLKGKIDSVFVTKNNQKYFSKLDSSEYKFKKIIGKQHLFHSEKVSEFLFKNKKLKEYVMGIKMSGFKQPVYEILGFNLQSFSVYDNIYVLLQTKYKSPISDDVVSDYSYNLLDTIAIDKRQCYAIYFKNRKKINQSGLEGLLYIDTQNFAVANAIMRVKNVIDISGIHNFEYLKEEKLWFPKSQIFKIVKGKNNEDIKLFGGTFQFDSDLDDNNKYREKHSSDYVYLLSETKNSEIEFNKIFNVRKAAIAVEVKEDATNKPEKFWNFYRKDSLDIRTQKTYQTLDSLVVKRKIEKRFLFGKKFINGFVPIGSVDLDLRKFINFNNYEGFRLCVAGITNEKLSRKFRIEGYTAYGIKDGDFKYNLGFAGRYGKFSNTWFGGSYTDDIQQIASTSFAIDSKQFKLFDTDLFNFSSFYNYTKWRTFVETRVIPKTESIWEISHSIINPKFNYLYKVNDRFYNVYNMTTALVSLQWKPFSRYIQTPVGRNEADEGFPIFNIQLTKSLPGIINNDFNFGKIDFKTSYEKTFLNGQKTNLMFALGYAFGDIPITHLYNNSPNSLNKDKIIQRISIEGDNDFETMYLNEFFSNKYAFFEFRHGLKKFNIAKKFKPTLVFITRMAIGNISKPEQHFGIEYKTLDKGYFESGIQINQIFKGLGVSTFYRHGPNQLSNFEDNLAIRISYFLDLGF